MSRFLRTILALAAFFSVIWPLPQCLAASATIDLQVVGQPRVVQGANAEILSHVSNTAAAGSDDLNFSISYAYPYGTSTLNNQVRVAGAGAGAPFSGLFDSSQTGLGTQTTTVTVTDPAATNSPVSAQFDVDVLTHAQPWHYVQVTGKPDVLAQEPDILPEQFAATGGGETFAARSSVINDPAVPTARLDLDDILVAGDAEIRAEFYSMTGSPQTMSEFIASFMNLTEIHEASGESVITNPALYEQYGRNFDIFVDTTTPGTFVKTWTFEFSDEDIPGATSVFTDFTMTATVAAVPIPAAVWLFGSALGLLGWMRRKAG